MNSFISQRLFVSVVMSVTLLMGAMGYASEYKVDPVHSNVQFTIRHMVSKVNGEFKDFDGTVDFDAKKPEASKVNATIKTASISTGNEKRDGHLKSGDFFDAEKNPTITFVSKKVTAAGKNKFKLMGDLTMHGVTKPVTFDVEYGGEMNGMDGVPVAGFTGTATVNRKDFGIVWNKMMDHGGAVLGDDVTITLNIEAKAASAKKM